ncbi:SUKH-4 family immunity protein [Streptomyces sp. NPDC006997]|uniref:SUKH-4 family immunity protein n=1 Tax=Streptomyces sp. NPDC006997 TaxID=3155356 RepID=UPI0033F10C00
MSTTDAGVATITFTEADLDRHAAYVTHAPTRRWLTGPGLPGGGDLFSFEALRRDGLRTVADSTADTGGGPAAELRDQLVIGGVRAVGGLEGESVLLDGATGEVSTAYFLHDRPDLTEASPLAPSLRLLVRFAAATDELAGLRGQFASYAGRYGQQVAADAARQLLAVFEEGIREAAEETGTHGESEAGKESGAGEDSGADGEGWETTPLFWRIAAVIRPLALVAGPSTRSGLAVDLPPRLLEEEFGTGAVVRFEDVDFPAALVHEPTRRFLREVGLPEDGVWFGLDTDVPLPTLAQYYADERESVFRTADVPARDRLPEGAHRLIRLGHLLEDTSLVVDGTTGAVFAWSEAETVLRPLNTDVSTLAFTLWLIHREKSLDAEYDLTDAYEHLAAAMARTLAAVDPLAVDPAPRTPDDDGWRYWPEMFEDEAGGGLCA